MSFSILDVCRYHANTICTWERDKDTCEGDSGGPLVMSSGPHLVLVGLTSWGPRRCGQTQAAS